MEVFLSLAALFFTFLAGFGVVLLLTQGDSRFSMAEIAGSAIVLGTGIVSLLLFLLGLILHDPALRWSVALICLAIAVVGWMRNRKVLAPSGQKLRSNGSQLVLIAVVLVQIAVISWVSLYLTHLGWDGLFNWESKARFVFLNRGSIPLHLYSRDFDFGHVRYPLLLPLTEAWIYSWLGQMNQSLIKLVGPYLYLGAMLLLVGGTTALFGGGWRRLIPVVFVGSVPTFVVGEGSATSGYADFPLAVVYLSASVHCVRYWQTRTAGSLRLLGATTVLLAWTKSEGIVLLCCIGAALLPLALWERKLSPIIGGVLPGVAMVVGWRVFLRVAHAPLTDEFTPVTWKVFVANSHRATEILNLTIRELGDWSRWSLLWPVVLMGFIYLAVRLRGIAWYPWTTLILGPVVMYPSVFFFSGWDPVRSHVFVYRPGPP